jgi:hypothetical protein
MRIVVFRKEKRMKKLADVFVGILCCFVIGCASSIKYTTGDEDFEKKINGPGSSKQIVEGTFPWEYQPVTVLVVPERRAAEFTAQWIGVDKSVVLRVFGEPTQKVPYPNGFSEECWYYFIRNTKWFVFVDNITNKVVDLQYQNPGQPMMTTGTRMSTTGIQTSPPEVIYVPAPEPVQDPVVIESKIPPGYKPYKSYR